MKTKTNKKLVSQKTGVFANMFNFQLGRKLREDVEHLQNTKKQHVFELNKQIGRAHV